MHNIVDLNMEVTSDLYTGHSVSFEVENLVVASWISDSDSIVSDYYRVHYYSSIPDIYKIPHICQYSNSVSIISDWWTLLTWSKRRSGRTVASKMSDFIINLALPI